MDPTPDGLDPLSRAILRRLNALTNAPKAWTQMTPGGTPRPAGTGAVTQGGRGREAQASMLTGGATHQEMPLTKGVGPSVVPYAKRNVRLSDVPPMVARGKGLSNHKAPGAPALAAGRSSRKVRSASAPNQQSRPAIY
jgi:hypothetical protein